MQICIIGAGSSVMVTQWAGLLALVDLATRWLHGTKPGTGGYAVATRSALLLI
ncbi:hypothetical protein [Rhodoferax antarcticus]|uniref:hypothetical protein n=1 Tax=Rhodoferax antarcticus TaxID=81479 RepID=UPI0012EB42DB|nr:hypothetical protein [Rhodoferax antarcticus]MCW2312165.1 hypothetical protein [Rhodoferax antarcticus]